MLKACYDSRQFHLIASAPCQATWRTHPSFTEQAEQRFDSSCSANLEWRESTVSLAWHVMQEKTSVPRGIVSAELTEPIVSATRFIS